MKNISIVVVLAALTSTFYAADVAFAAAGPTISPSVKAAARLKYNPPRNWIRHYLGDDRYKIAGGVWKVVTTPNDKFYYPAYAAEMLRRSPNNVIGFSSTDEAIEAGYAAHPRYFATYNARFTAMGAQDLRSGNSSSTTSSTRSSRNPRKSRRILLSDGRSSVILPAGWDYIKTSPQRLEDGSFVLEMLASPDSKKVVAICIGNVPSLAKMLADGDGLNIEKIKASLSRLSSKGVVDPRPTNASQVLSTMRNSRLGGLRAFTVVDSRPFIPGVAGQAQITATARGAKVYMFITQGSSRASGVSTIYNSFRPR